ncbi:MAG TPA: hypothetical protein VF605_20035 [Allosphingosinicella sp.]|jgi:hypothetical protein
MEKPESRIAPSPGAASDDSASPSNLQRREPADRLAFEPVPLRYREDGFTPEKQRAYVEALADCGIAREAAARVGLTEQAINRARRRSDARSFDDACEAAHLFGARRIRSTVWERAIEGTVKGRYYHGELIAEERVHDNRLLTYLYGKVEHLLARDEKKSRDICDNWEAHMEALDQGLPAPGREPEAPSAECAEEEEFTGVEVWETEGIWWTGFPPPADFDGIEEGRYGDLSYRRSLSDLEQAEIDAEAEEELAEACARRDRFFGFPGGALSSPEEAETYETSEPSDPDPRPIEYKSAAPPEPGPCPILAAQMRVHAEARRRGGTWRFIRDRTLPPAPAARDFRSASPEEPWKRGPLRASAPPREPDPDPALRSPHIQTPPPRHPYR